MLWWDLLSINICPSTEPSFASFWPVGFHLAGARALCFETGATVLPAVIVRQGLSEHHQLASDHHSFWKPHDDLQANIRHNTQRINHIIEDWIRQFPEQWLWLHKRWKVQDHPEGWDIPQELGHLA
ncbi:MAG: hypothetical protein R3C68_15530 [Myxococcota bacterium]